jgi:hypothetical protein
VVLQGHFEDMGYWGLDLLIQPCSVVKGPMGEIVDVVYQSSVKKHLRDLEKVPERTEILVPSKPLIAML